jgi:thymidylate synthase
LWDFSDDGETWRAGYGPRIRRYDNATTQYYEGHNWSPKRRVDQLRFVIETLKHDPQSRQAVITIADPVKDDFNDDGTLLQTRDVPCTRSLHFMTDPDGALNMYTQMRSNDLLHGFSAVNVPNFTLMQEYVAKILEMPVGRYYHMVDNMHVYDFQMDRVEAVLDNEGVDIPYHYVVAARSLVEFDSHLRELRSAEERMQSGDYFPLEELAPDQLFDDWRRALALKIMEKRDEVDFEKLSEFFHPELQYILDRKKENS